MHDVLLLWSVRLAFACYIAALAIRIAGKTLSPQRRRIIATFWTAGAAAFLVHLWAAFQFVHHWSHADAWQETARQTRTMTGIDSGAGIWLNYCFALLWVIDVILCLLAGDCSLSLNSRRPGRHRLNVSIQIFFAFMWLNATIVFGHGTARGMGIAGTIAIVFAVAKRAQIL